MEKNVVPEALHVVISGISRGLGAATARELLSKGYAVSGFSRRSSPEVEQLAAEYGTLFHFAVADIASSAEIKEFLKHARAKLGPVYGLVNNAATVQDGILVTLPEVDIARMLDVNLGAAIRLSRLCLRDMVIKGRGRVVNISSIVGARGYNGLTIYSATKAGLDGFTRGLAREAGKRNVTVNSVAPGYMRTEMSAGLGSSELDQIARRTPLGRLADIGDVVPLIRFLMSSEAAFLTGQTIMVDGGISN
jgi:3-oxoacyl-[acyl-carrier protein] reductase